MKHKKYSASFISFLLLIFILTSCSRLEPHTNVNTAFSNFTNKLFQQEVSSTTINLHYTLHKPSEYGILNTPVTYGSFSTDTITAMASLENCQAALQSFPYNSLTQENQLTYDILNDYLRMSAKGTTYLLYEEPLSPITGIQAQLPILLAEYEFDDANDVDTYLNLIETTPEYFDSLIDFELEKSEKGLFMSHDIVDAVLKQCRSFISMEENNYLFSTFEERINTIPSLSEHEKAHYLTQNKTILEKYLFPSYQKLIATLSKLRDTGINTAGVCGLPDGKKYYEYVVERETGSSRTISELKALIKKQMASDATSISKLLTSTKNQSSETSAIPELSLGDNSPATFLEDLKHKIPNSFPNAPDVTTNIKYVPKSMEPYLSPAFYLIPCIDNISENIIYINQSHNIEKLNLYTTLAHEGYPGHLYQTIYYANQNKTPLRSLLNYGGYVEGWATYAEMCSYYLTPLDKKAATLAQKNSSLILGLYATADIGIHYDNWSLSDTISYFSKYGITDKKTITEIYKLIVSDPANYLKYYIGYVEFLELKKEVMQKEGCDFSQKEFHKAVLDVGPASFDIVRKYVLKKF